MFVKEAACQEDRKPFLLEGKVRRGSSGRHKSAGRQYLNVDSLKCGFFARSKYLGRYETEPNLAPFA
jgi:hypothetical protein